MQSSAFFFRLGAGMGSADRFVRAGGPSSSRLDKLRRASQNGSSRIGDGPLFKGVNT